jgi:hypothetical protein
MCVTSGESDPIDGGGGGGGGGNICMVGPPWLAFESKSCHKNKTKRKEMMMKMVMMKMVIMKKNM